MKTAFPKLYNLGSLSLRVKLVIGFVVLALISVATVAFVTNGVVTKEVTREAGESLASLADSTALSIAQSLQANVDQITQLALNKLVQDTAEAANNTNPSSPGVLANLDQQWHQASNSDTLVKNVLDNEVAGELREFQGRFVGYNDIIVTDKYGATISASSRPENYYHAQEEWWQAAFNNGAGGVYVAPGPVFDETHKENELIIAIGMPSHEGTDIIGVLFATVDISEFNAEITAAQFGETGAADLVFANNTVIGPELELEDPAPGTLDLVKTANQTYIQASFEDAPSFVSVYPISLGEENTDKTIENLGWSVLVYETQAEAFSPATAATRTALFVSLLVLAGGVLAALFLGYQFTNPLAKLADTAARLGQGDLSARAEITSTDEVGLLAKSFNTMSDQLKGTLDGLEQTVAERTKELEAAQVVLSKRAGELQSVAEISTKASLSTNLQEMLQTVVEETKRSYKLYHTHIYMLDETKTKLVLAAGAGDAGRKMVKEKRTIEIDRPHSLVARAARTNEGAISNDVSKEPDFLPNPLLPDTKAEMAIPIAIGETILGVLDVQADYVNRFTDEDIAIKTTLAQQVATSIQNIRSYERAEQSLRDLDAQRYALDQHSIVGITDVTGKIIYANDKFSEISKYPREEILGQDHRILNSGYHSKEFMRNLWVTIANGKVFHDEIKNKAKDGSFYWVDTTIVPLLNDKGKPYQYIAIRTDITQRKFTEELMAKRAVELQSVAEISTKASQALDIQDMLQTVVDLTKSSYSLYHTHIYLLDDNNTTLTLTAGAGDVGRQMVNEKRTIPYDHPHSLVARAARTERGAISNDITKEPDFLPNPLLPDTRAEMAIPIKAGDKVLGVLDVQADYVNRFTEEDIAIKTTLAQQVAASLENLRQFQIAQKVAGELATVAEISTVAATIPETGKMLHEVVDQTKAAFNLYHVHIYLMNEAGDTLELAAGAGDVGRQMVADGTTIPLDSEKSLVARAARTRKGQVVNDVKADPDFLPNPLLPDTHSEMAVPMVISDRVIGVLDVQSELLNRFTEIDVNIKTTLAAQVAAALDNARQYQIAQKVAGELGIVAEISTATAAIADTNQMFHEVVDRTKSAFNLYHVHIYLVNEAGDTLELAAGAGEVGKQMIAKGTSIPFDSEKSLVARAAQTRKGQVVNDVKADPDFLPNPLLPDTRSEMAVPMVVGNQVIGVLDVQSELLNRFTEIDVNIKTTLATQISTAYENAQQFQISQKVAGELATVAEISTAAATISETDKMLHEVVDRTKAAFNLYHVHIYLMNDAGDTLVLAAGAGEVGRKMVAHGASISLDSEKSLVARATRTRKGQVVNDVRADPDFLPNPLLPDTRSEMAVPMIISDRVIGVLDVQSELLNRFSDIDVNIKTTLAAQVAAALDNARQYQIAQKVAGELGIVAEISTAAVAIADTNQMFQEVVDRTKSAFSLYHVHIYLMNDAGDTLELAAGAGEVGKQMVAHGTSIPFDSEKSLVARAAQTRKGQVVNDVKADPDFLPNPLLPDTHSEMAIPMVVGNQVIGVLDVQSEVLNRFTEIDVNIKTTLATQISTAYENAQQFQISQKVASELGTVAEISTAAATISETDKMLLEVVDRTKAAFSLYHVHIYLMNNAGDTLELAAGAGEVGRKMVAEEREIPLNSEKSLVARAARTRKGQVVNDVKADPDFLPNPLLPDTRAEMAVPMIISDRVIGVLDVQSELLNRFTEIDVNIKTTLAAQVAAALDNARQYQIAQKVAGELGIVAEISTATAAIADTNQMFHEVVDRTKSAFNLYHVQIYLMNEAGDTLELAAGAGEVGKQMIAKGTSIPFDSEKSLVARAAQTRKGQVVNDVKADPDFLPNPLLPDTRAEMAVPMVVGNQVIGVLDVQSELLNRFTEIDVNIKTTLATQISTAYENAQQFQISQKVAGELATVAEISTASAAISDPKQMLQEVVDKTKAAFNLYHVHIYLTSDAGDTLELAAGAGDVGRKMVAEEREIPLNSEKSLVARAARARKGQVVNDVRADPDFLPNPLLPDTRAEMAVPMVVGNQVIGVLDVQSELLNRFTEIDVNIKTTLAAQTAVALQNAHTFTQAQKQAEREAMLNTIGQKIQSATTVEAVLQIAARELGRALEAPLTIAQLGMNTKVGAGVPQNGNGNGKNGH